MNTLSVDLPIYTGPILHADRLIQLCRGRHRVVIVTDSHVGQWHAAPLLGWLETKGITAHVVTVTPGEAAKTRAVKAGVEDQLFGLGCGRDTVLIALGGGVVTDLTGFVAATFCRGISVIYIPTSLLAMVDAAIGGKTGINTSWGKNTLGTFTLPCALFLDMTLLSTLPVKEYGAGFAEMLKHGLIQDADYAKQIMALCGAQSGTQAVWPPPVATLLPLVMRSIALKTAIVKADCTEKGVRALLNFGHSVGHAMEAASAYRLSHGMAVALGLWAESWLSWQTGRLEKADFMCISHSIKGLLRHLQWEKVQAVMGAIALPAYVQALSHDKKNRDGKVRMVLLNAIGEASQTPGIYTHPVSLAQIKQALTAVFRFL